MKGIPDGEEREKGIEEIFKAIVTENFPKVIPNHSSRKLREQAGHMPKSHT